MLFVAFPLLLLVFFLYLSFCHFDYNVSWCVPFLVNPVWDSLCFPDLHACFLFLGREIYLSSNILYLYLQIFSWALSLLFLGPL